MKGPVKLMQKNIGKASLPRLGGGAFARPVHGLVAIVAWFHNWTAQPHPNQVHLR
jgi:hypothetical protein